jgi:hypothetical protein
LTQLTITPPADFFRAGGYLFVTLDTSNAGDPYVVGWNANHEVLKRYAARIPPLTTASQPLFAPVLFPVDATATSGYDDVFVEADLYADGFAQVVHCFQPDSIDASQTDPSTIAPATDAGIQIGWDDEQVMAWHRRQANNAFLRASNQEAAPEAPGRRADKRWPVALADDRAKHASPRPRRADARTRDRTSRDATQLGNRHRHMAATVLCKLARRFACHPRRHPASDFERESHASVVRDTGRRSRRSS